ncbi:MAG: bifunctional riboflavin kinase/FAD synthetase [Alphaproteobacteria bacterium]
MRVLRHYRNVEAAARGAVVAIGNFDGLHRGHAAVIAGAGRIARESGAPWAVLTFDPHPRHFFGRDTRPFRLTPFRIKAQLLAEMGLDYLFNLRFDTGMAGLPARDFVLQVLLDGLGVRHVVVGPGFVFGKGRLGDGDLLRDMAAREGFGFTEIEAVHSGGARCSSTDVRGLIRRGLVDEAAELIGRLWEIEGRVETGAAYGQALGFPTANLALDRVLHPGPGIYAVRARVGDGNGVAWRDGVAYIGTRPTFAGTTLALEVHLFDFDGDLYGRRLRVAFVKRVRKDQTFDGPESLAAQMALDCRLARQILADARAASGSAAPLTNPPAA